MSYSEAKYLVITKSNYGTACICLSKHSKLSFIVPKEMRLPFFDIWYIFRLQTIVLCCMPHIYCGILLSPSYQSWLFVYVALFNLCDASHGKHLTYIADQVCLLLNTFSLTTLISLKIEMFLFQRFHGTFSCTFATFRRHVLFSNNANFWSLLFIYQRIIVYIS